MVRAEQEAAGAGGERRQLGALAGQASALLQRAQQLLAAAKAKAAATLRFLGEDTPAEPAFSQQEPRRMLTDLSDFFTLLARAHGDGERMAVCLATLAQQREEEEAERRARLEAAAEEEAGAEGAAEQAPPDAVAGPP